MNSIPSEMAMNTSITSLNDLTLKSSFPNTKTPDDHARVSVIVPTFNRAEYIEECLSSLLAQTIAPYEIIVVDDGSEDDTALRVTRFRDKIKYFKKVNGGKATAVNYALSVVSGDLVWLFDDDDVALPNAIEDRLEALRRKPDAGFVYSPHYLGTDGPNHRIVRGKLHDSSYYHNDDFLYELMKGCFFHFATTLVRKDVYDAVGPFDEKLHRSQDYDFQIRLARHSRAAFCPNPTFIFRQHAGLRGPKTIRSQSKSRSTVFRHFDQFIGKKLLETLSIGEYLTPPTSSPLGARQLRLAYLSRMLVMASKGCIVEMLNDLSSALKVTINNAPLSIKETNALRNIFCVGYASESFRATSPDVHSILKLIGKLPNGPSALINLSWGLVKVVKSYPGTTREKMKNLSNALSILYIAIFG